MGREVEKTLSQTTSKNIEMPTFIVVPGNNGRNFTFVCTFSESHRDKEGNLVVFFPLFLWDRKSVVDSREASCRESIIRREERNVLFSPSARLFQLFLPSLAFLRLYLTPAGNYKSKQARAPWVMIKRAFI
jgi:hypothetical protein